MKGQAELNALLLLTKRWQELKVIKIKPYNGYGEIDLEDVPESMLNYFTEKINDVVKAEVEKAAALVEQAALKYAEAAAKNGCYISREMFKEKELKK